MSESERLALIIDDSPTALAVLSRMLRRLQVTVDTVLSGEEALIYLKDHLPDIIFLDHIMPGMDGFEALRSIKGSARTKTIPVVMYTSQKERKYAEEAKQLGAADVINKQVTGGILSQVLDHVWQGSQPANDPDGFVESLVDVVDEVNRSQIVSDAAVAEEQAQRELMGLKTPNSAYNPLDRLFKYYLDVQLRELQAANEDLFQRFSTLILAKDDEPKGPPARSSFLLSLIFVMLAVVSTTVSVSLYEQMDRQKREVTQLLQKIERENLATQQATTDRLKTLESQYRGSIKDQANLLSAVKRLSAGDAKTKSTRDTIVNEEVEATDAEETEAHQPVEHNYSDKPENDSDKPEKVEEGTPEASEAASEEISEDL
jgi:CheY-like chemotaxis protein